MTGRTFLKVSGCDDHNSIALDNLTGNELGLLTELCAALVAAQEGHGCRPVATLTPVDPDADEREPETWGGVTEPPVRPLHVVTGTADPVDEPSGVPEPCRSTLRNTGVACRLDEGHDGNHRYYAHASDDPWTPRRVAGFDV